MSKKIFSHPSIEEESHFHELNALIVKSQNVLCGTPGLSYFDVHRLVIGITEYRKRAKTFNKKFGLHKEIA